MQLELFIWVICTFYSKSIYTCDILAFNMPVESRTRILSPCFRVWTWGNLSKWNMFPYDGEVLKMNGEYSTQDKKVHSPVSTICICQWLGAWGSKGGPTASKFTAQWKKIGKYRFFSATLCSVRTGHATTCFSLYPLSFGGLTQSFVHSWFSKISIDG